MIRQHQSFYTSHIPLSQVYITANTVGLAVVIKHVFVLYPATVSGVPEQVEPEAWY